MKYIKTLEKDLKILDVIDRDLRKILDGILVERWCELSREERKKVQCLIGRMESILKRYKVIENYNINW